MTNEAPLNNIRIVLVDTHFPGNIGAAARAMKTMGMRSLWLVRPVAYPHTDATRMATEAADVLEAAIVVDHLEQALADCALSVALSARQRSTRWTTVDMGDAANRIIDVAEAAPVAVVFGPEPSGLTSDDIYRTQLQASIATSDQCRSLNLAQAVQVAAYEIFRAARNTDGKASGQFPDRATYKQLEHLYDTLRHAIIDSGFARRDPDHLLRNFRRMFGRAQLTDRDVSLLEGLIRRLGNH